MATAKKSTKKPVKSGSKIVASKGKFSLSSLQKKLVAVAAVVVLGAGGFWLYNDLQDGQLFAASCVSNTYRQGSSGTCVKYIQTLANHKLKNAPGYYNNLPALTADGAFGAKTTTAIKAIQNQYKLTRDGVVGKNTWRVLCSITTIYMAGAPFNSTEAAAAKSAGC